MVRQRSKLLVVRKAMIEARTMHGLAKIDFVDCITGNYEPSYDNRP